MSVFDLPDDNDLNEDDSDDDDDDDYPGALWGSDTPSGVIEALGNYDLTGLNTTQILFEMGDIKEGFLLVRFCEEERHVHAVLDRSAPMAQCSVAAVIAYSIALSLDRIEWRTRTISPADAIKTWEDVLSIINMVHPSLAEFLEQGVTNGALGSPVEWCRNFSGHNHNTPKKDISGVN
jgi:hypothetical protein